MSSTSGPTPSIEIAIGPDNQLMSRFLAASGIPVAITGTCGIGEFEVISEQQALALKGLQ